MTEETHSSGNAKAVIQRTRVLQDHARSLREEAVVACEYSTDIREVLLVNDPLRSRHNSPYRDRARVIDVLDRILDRGIVVEPWRRVTLTGITLSRKGGRSATILIQTHLLNEEMVVRKRKRLRLPPCTGTGLGILRPANFLDMLDRILDKGIVVDSWQHIHVAGIDMLGVEVHPVASIQTHLFYGSPHVGRAALEEVACS